MYTVKEYKNAEVELKKLRQIENSEELKKDEIKEEIHSKSRNKKWKLEDRIRAIERTCEKQREIVENKFKKVKAGIDLKAQPYHDVVTETKDLFNFIGVYLFDRKSLEIPDGAFEIISDDEYKKIGIFILKNRKPVNKFSLTLIGESFFQYRFTERSERTLKDAPSEEILLAWWKENKANFLDHYLKHHAELEEKYREAIRLYGFKKWKMAYLRHMKDYYENHYSHGTDTEMYKGVLECMKILKTKQKDLPLLVGEIVAPEGLKELESRLKGEAK
jgi:hypothetical protein